MITQMEEKIIKYIAEYYRKILFYPSYDEIAEGVHRAKATIHIHIKKLENEGIIIRKSEFSPQYRLINAEFIRRESAIK